MESLLLIPGIGGHPRFHQRLIDGLRQHFHVHTAPHGDFEGAPYGTLESHVDYWMERLDAVGDADVHVVAISFGAHVVPQLVARRPGLVRQVLLLSPWVQGHTDQALLRMLAKLPEQSAASALASVLMRWTDVQGGNDADEVRRNRAELYDAPESVAARWHMRLLSIRSSGALTWDALVGLSQQHRVLAMLGRRECLWRLQGRHLTRLADNTERLEVVVVDGGHEIGTITSPAVMSQVVNSLRNRGGARCGKS